MTIIGEGKITNVHVHVLKSFKTFSLKNIICIAQTFFCSAAFKDILQFVKMMNAQRKCKLKILPNPYYLQFTLFVDQLVEYYYHNAG